MIECSDYRATLLLGTGTLVVRTPAGACFVYGVAGEMQMAFGNAVKLSRHEWQETRPWLALPWNNARIVETSNFETAYTQSCNNTYTASETCNCVTSTCYSALYHAS